MHECAKHAIANYFSSGQIVGLGSGSTMAAFVGQLTELPLKSSIRFITTSLQIEIEAEKAGLEITDVSKSKVVDIVFDGADQIDSNYNMIKGGGGALLNEKLLISAANKVVILADFTKYVERFTRSIPIEIHKSGRSIIQNKLEKLGGRAELRVSRNGYPYFTENGNLILDTLFSFIEDPIQMEVELKHIPGIFEVGLFSRGDVYYKIKKDGSFEVIQPGKG
jgi:ribose 5-phosphate isomerase A